MTSPTPEPAPLPDEVDVVVVGAGLAGLRCAAVLESGGLTVAVLEAQDVVGGRVRTDRVDGFLLDRGFQLLNPSYPALACVDLDALDLQAYPAAVAARTHAGRTVLADPLRAPRELVGTAGALARRPRELLALARLVRPLLPRLGVQHGLDHQLLRARADETLRSRLDATGVHGLTRAVLERFLAGVVLEDRGETSATFALLLLRSFLAGSPSVPATGMQALPHQLARSLHSPVRLGCRVSGIEESAQGVQVRSSRGEVRARAVVVATDADGAAELLARPMSATKGVVTDWYSVPVPPASSGVLHVEARGPGHGPVVNTALVSAAAPGYAPAGRHLVQASALLPTGSPPVSEAEVRRHAGDLFGVPSDDWELLARHVVPHALPVQPAPLRTRTPVRVTTREWVCGDHRDTGSLQGALVSGARTAREVRDALAGS